MQKSVDFRRADLPYPILSAHQPEFMPWLGNLSKAALGDVYYILDNVQYVSGVFQNRNKIRIKNGPGWQWLNVPIKSTGQLQMWNEVEIDNTNPWKRKHLNAIRLSYSKAPYFDTIYPEIESLYNSYTGDKLIEFIVPIIQYAFFKFDINIPVKRTSEIKDIRGRKSDLILSMCKSCNAKSFVFGSFGKTYIEWDKFNDVTPAFQDFKHPVYDQIHGGEFIPNMSFIDLLFNHGDDSKNILTKSKYTYE